MKHTTLEAPKNKKNAMIPDGEALSSWSLAFGDASP
jgi:hypothetical protein